MPSSTLRCPECGTPHEDPPDAGSLPSGTTIHVTCTWCGERYGATVYTSDDPADDIPPGMLALAQLVGGGTATVAGNLRGNVVVESAAQYQGAIRQHGAAAVNRHADVQVDVDVDVSPGVRERLKRLNQR